MWNIEYMREKAARQLSSREDMNNMQNCRVVCLQLTRSADLSLGGGAAKPELRAEKTCRSARLWKPVLYDTAVATARVFERRSGAIFDCTGGKGLEAAKQLRGWAAKQKALLPRREKLSEALMRVIQYA